jgi:hypothetical protein
MRKINGGSVFYQFYPSYPRIISPKTKMTAYRNTPPGGIKGLCFPVSGLIIIPRFLPKKYLLWLELMFLLTANHTKVGNKKRMFFYKSDILKKSVDTIRTGLARDELRSKKREFLDY